MIFISFSPYIRIWKKLVKIVKNYSFPYPSLYSFLHPKNFLLFETNLGSSLRSVRTGTQILFVLSKGQKEHLLSSPIKLHLTSDSVPETKLLLKCSHCIVNFPSFDRKRTYSSQTLFLQPENSAIVLCKSTLK